MVDSLLQTGSSAQQVVTIEDVAQRAGFSASTVSRALNDKGKATWPSAQRRIERIKKIAREMNYIPNSLSQAFLKGKSMAVGVIIKGLEVPAATAHIKHFMHAAQEQGYLTYTVNIDQPGDDSEHVARIAKDLLARQVDGLVIYRNLPIHVETRRFLESLGVPVVFAGDWGPTSSKHRVVLDFEAGIDQAAEYLGGLGHHHAAFFPSPGLADFPEHKLLPYQRCFKQAGIELVADSRWQIGSVDSQTGPVAQKVVKDFLNDNDSMGITALLFSNDFAAAGAVAAITAAGLRVPEDISVIGFDNHEVSLFTNPKLTTIGGAPVEKVGRATFKMLHELMENPQVQVEKKVFPFELVVRNSTGPAKQYYEQAYCDINTEQVLI